MKMLGLHLQVFHKIDSIYMSISVSAITKIYGTQKALSDVSFSIKTGEIVGFLGPNGAGKSTMMKILTGYIPQTSGNASVAEYDVLTESIKVKAKIGYLPENNPLYNDMFVSEYLQFVAGSYKAPKNRVAELIEKTGLTPEKHKKIDQLSKGYRQRVGLAAALIHDPEVLILDEPTTGLDPNQLVEIRNLIKEVGHSKTVLLSTHIMQEVEQLCDRVIIINKGEIVADKTISELKNLTTGKIIIVEFDAACNSNQLKKVEGVKSVRALSPTRFELSSTDAQVAKQNIFQFAVANKLAIVEIAEQAKNLEGIFRQLTNG